MAEVLGIISGGIAILQLTVAVGKSINQIKTLWDEVNDVPETVQNLITRLEPVNMMITDIENDLRQHSATQKLELIPSFRQSMVFCKSASDQLSELVEELKTQIESQKRRKRMVAKVRIALDRKLVLKHEKRLDCAIQLLTLAYQMHTKAMMETQVTSIITSQLAKFLPNQYTNNVHEAGRLLEKTEDSDTDGSEVDCSDVDDSDTDSDIEEIPRSDLRYYQKPKQRGNTYQYKVPLLGWFTRTFHEVLVSRSCAGWQLNLRTYSRRPDDSPVFDVVGNGEVEELQRMFDTGEASPFDIDEVGWTLLHYAFSNSREETIRLLLSLGADSNARNDYNDLTIESLYVGESTEIFKQFESLVYIVRSFGDEDADDVQAKQETLALLWAVGENFHPSKSILQHWILAAQPDFYDADYGRSTLANYLFGAAWSCQIFGFQMSPFWFRKGGKLNPANEFVGIPVPVAISSMLFSLSFRHEPDLIYEGLSYFLESASPEILTRRSFQRYWSHDTDDGHIKVTPLCGLVAKTWRDYYELWFVENFNQPWTKPSKAATQTNLALQWWLKTLKDCLGADFCLEEYGKVEAGFFEPYLNKTTPNLVEAVISHGDPNFDLIGLMPHDIVLKSFKFGKNPEDWSIELEVDPTHALEDFWAMVEDPLWSCNGMPGSWVEDK